MKKLLTHFVDDLGYYHMIDISKIEAITDVVNTYMKDGRDRNPSQIAMTGGFWFTVNMESKELCNLLGIELEEIL